MRTRRRIRSRALSDEIVPKLDGMEIEFDEKVTLFPVDLEEIRTVAPQAGKAVRRNGSAALR
jgi:hypothetical protein